MKWILEKYFELLAVKPTALLDVKSENITNTEPAMSRYLSVASAVLTSLFMLALTAAAVDTFTITAARAIVRVKPGITHPILTVVPHGAIFPVVETQEDWHKVLLEDGREGWINREVWRVEQEAGRSTVVAPPPATVPAAQNRWALVIGNAAYGSRLVRYRIRRMMPRTWR
jgi:hypothetical protein